MINKDLYMMKVADEETTYEHFGGTAYDPKWMPSYLKTTSRYSSYAEPSWTKDPKVLKKHKIYWNTDNYSDSNDSYWIDMDARDAFKDAGENSGIKKVHYTAFPNTSVGWFEGAPAENYELSKKHPFLARLKGFDAGKYEKFMADIASKNRLGLNKDQTDAYDKDFADRYGKAITPERYNELQRLQGTPEYKKKLKEYVTPWARDYSKKNVKEKTAALAEELNPLKTQVRTDVNIRKADATDLNAILELFNSLSAEDVKFLAYNTKAALIRQLIRSGKHCYVATDKNKIIGFLRESGRPEGYSLLEELVVHPKYRGKKVASKLLRYFHNSFPKTLAKTNAMNTVMQNILKANGYLPENPNSPRIINWRRGNNLLNTGKEKTATLAKELNPVPKPKRKRSVFQKFGDTLSTNKVKHIVGVAGGISGMLTGKELLHSNLTPMRALGGVGVVGGAALGAKNIYGLYEDYSD